MCTFDRAECTDGRVLAAGGAAIRGSTGRSSEFSDRVLDRNSSDANYRGRTFVMYQADDQLPGKAPRSTWGPTDTSTPDIGRRG